MIIDLAKYPGPIYLGRDTAKAIREEFDLDAADKSEVEVHILVPSDAYTMTSSFFIGLFGRSVAHAKSREKFLAKYKFSGNPFILSVVDKHLTVALRTSF